MINGFNKIFLYKMKRAMQTKQARLQPKDETKMEAKETPKGYVKKAYELTDVVLAEKDFNNIHFQLLKNEKGTFVDLRRFYMHRPTTKGIRMTPEAFQEIMTYANEALNDWKESEEKEAV